MATRSQLEAHIRRQQLKIKCLEKNGESPRDFIAERRYEQACKYERMKNEAGHWLDGGWRIIRKPCKCGRNHYALQSNSGLGEIEHCPLTWWGRLMLFANDRERVRDLYERIVRPIITLEGS